MRPWEGIGRRPKRRRGYGQEAAVAIESIPTRDPPRSLPDVDLPGPKPAKKPVKHHAPLYRCTLVKEGSVTYTVRPQIKTSESAYWLLREIMGDCDREMMVVLLLDSSLKLIGANIASIGVLNQTYAEPSQIFKPAILANANAVIIGHNHPSGDPTPSQPDREATARAQEAGKILGIKLLDHIIVAYERYYSFTQNKFDAIPASMPNPMAGLGKMLRVRL